MHLLLPLLLSVAGPAQAATPGISSTAEQSSTVTPKEMSQNATEMMAEIEGAVTTVTKLLETANNEKPKNEEMIKCLKDKLPVITTVKELAARSNSTMKSKLAAGDGNADTEYRQVAVMYGRAKELLAAAQQCVKNTAGESGKGITTITGGSDAVEAKEIVIAETLEFSPS